MELPNQKVSAKAKEKDDFIQGSIKYFIGLSDVHSTEVNRIQRAYDLFNGVIKSSDYSYVINPFNTDKEAYKRFPARLRHYPVLESRIRKMIGEKIQRPFQWNVVASNPDVLSNHDKEIHQLFLNNLSNLFVNTINQSMDTGVDDQPVMTPDKIQERLENLPKDHRIQQGSESLEYLWMDLNLDEKFIEGFMDWLITDRVYSYKTVRNNDVEYEIVPGDEISYDKSRNVTDVEDGEWVVRRKSNTVAEVINNFEDLLTEDQIKAIKNDSSRTNLQSVRMSSSSITPPTRHVEVIHVVWRSYEKYGILTYTTTYGETETMEVEETYIPSPDEDVEWKWKEVVWEGYRINGNIYVGCQKFPVQRQSMSNKPCKLPYNGRRLSIRNQDGLSPFEKCIPFQLLYNIFHYRFELTMAKSHDKILLIPRNVIPNKDGWDEDKFMYYGSALGYAYIDVNSGLDVQAMQAIKVLDMSLDKFAATSLEILQVLRDEIDETLGMSRQRMGEMGVKEGKATSEAAIHQSATISENIFYRYEKFQEKELRGLLDNSKYAWVEGKKKHFVTRDGREVYFQLNPKEYVSTDYDVFVTISAKEQQKLDMLRQAAFAFAQNSTRPSMVAELYDTENFSKIKSLIKKFEQAERQYQQALQEAEANAEAQAQQADLMDKEKERLLKKYEIDQKTYSTIQAALIQAQKSVEEGGDLPSPEEVLQNMEERMIERERLNVEREKIAADKKISEDKVKIAKENKTKHEMGKSNTKK